MKYQAVFSGLGEHIHIPIEGDNDKQAYARAAEYAENHLPKLLRQYIKVSPLAEGKEAKDDRAELKFAPDGQKMGRPSQGRSVRLQAAITPELMAWLEEQRAKLGERSISDVVFKLLEKDKKMAAGLTSQQVEEWATSMLNEATDDMSEKDMEITPESLSAFFEKEYELPFTLEEAKDWLNKQEWYKK